MAREGLMLNDVNKLAREIAISAPLRRNKHYHAAYVPWVLIEELRVALEAQGFDWRAARRLMQEITNSEKRFILIRRLTCSSTRGRSTRRRRTSGNLIPAAPSATNPNIRRK